mmetsp:Transcript_19716/g.22838  ORF Transcript_19716/g.22838 Transcript_19716/m.22838 type:complete len:484 (+) Transcript_19716:393-1844(+)
MQSTIGNVNGGGLSSLSSWKPSNNKNNVTSSGHSMTTSMSTINTNTNPNTNNNNNNTVANNHLDHHHSQQIDKAPKPVITADYSTIRVPLPKPPSNLAWKRNDCTREWTLVDTKTTKPNDNYNHEAAHTNNTKNRADSMCSHTSSLTDASIKVPWDIDGDTSGNKFDQVVHRLVPGEGTRNHNTHQLFSSSSTSTSTLDSNDNDDTFSYTAINRSFSSSSSTGTATKSFQMKQQHHYTMIEHIILPNDTLQGICIQYKISATRLRQGNQFSGSSLILAPKKLCIPVRTKNLGTSMIKLQNQTTEEYKIHKVLAECSNLGMMETQAYLELHNWNVDQSIDAAKADIEWEKSCSIMEAGGGGGEEMKASDEPYNVKVNLRLTHQNHHQHGEQICKNLLELKSIKDSAERWEELSCTNSYKSCIDNSENIPLSVVGLPVDANQRIRSRSQSIHLEDYYKAPPIDYGIEMKEMTSVAKQPTVVRVPG